jgi:hypothetical protein
LTLSPMIPGFFLSLLSIYTVSYWTRPVFTLKQNYIKD